MCVFICIQLYGGDLESEFSQFQDWLQTFPLYKGRASAEDEIEDEEERLMGKYKVLWMESCLSVCLTLQRLSLFHPLYPQGSFLVYPLDPGDKEDITVQITSGIPKNSPLKVLVRVYIVKVPLSTSIHHLSCWNGVVFYGVILSLSVSCRQPICLPKTRMVKPTLIWWFGLESSFWTAKIDTSLNSSTLHSESQYLSVYVVQILCLSVCLSD